MLRLVENAPSGADEIPVRRAVKAVIMVPPTEPNESPGVILLESEKSGRFNIPGGGVKGDEDPFETFTREISEELGEKALGLILYLEILDDLNGPATTSEGKNIFVHWKLLLMVLPKDAKLARGDGVAKLHHMSAEDAMNHPMLTDMAKRAIQSVIVRGFDDLFGNREEVTIGPKNGQRHLKLVAG